jgi:hypothetical protein
MSPASGAELSTEPAFDENAASGGKTDALDAIRAAPQRARQRAAGDTQCWRRAPGVASAGRRPRGSGDRQTGRALLTRVRLLQHFAPTRPAAGDVKRRAPDEDPPFVGEEGLPDLCPLEIGARDDGSGSPCRCSRLSSPRSIRSPLVVYAASSSTTSSSLRSAAGFRGASSVETIAAPATSTPVSAQSAVWNPWSSAGALAAASRRCACR